jgi:hypothetical protein
MLPELPKKAQPMKHLLLVAHIPSTNTSAMRDAVAAGVLSPEVDSVELRSLTPFEAGPDDVKWAHVLILGTTENLGYMSGAMKDFFDRIYYPCLEETQGKPYALYIRAGHDGTGTRRGIETITTGLRWRAIQPPLICRGDYQPEFLDQCRDFGLLVAASLEAGIV